MIKAPYNFVPLAQKIVFPEWASQISIDRPFEDGISGTINVTYTAQTPIFIGNGKKDNNSVISNYKAANGKYAIPGSSIRGMLRNVIEIASFGKFNRVSDAALSVRDLQNKKLYTQYFTKTENGAFKALAKAGWLDQCEDTGEWFLYPVNYHRIEVKAIENCYNINNLKDCNPKNRLKKISTKVKIFFTHTLPDNHKHHKNPKTGKNLMLRYSKVKEIGFQHFDNSKSGFVVLTGVCGRKHMDFIFEDKNNNPILIEQKLIKTFDDINIPDSSNQKEGIALRKELKMYKSSGYPGMPIFYLTNEEGSVDSFGLAQMYKLPYKNTLHDAIKNSSEDNFSDRLDFAECLFGKIRNTKKDSSECNFSLRGRVQFEDATTDNGVLGSKVETILNNPKPTYYPNYIEQNSSNSNYSNSNYKTLMDNDACLRGWKRYPVRNKPNPMTVGAAPKKVSSCFRPLQPNIVFTGKIHFHNLKKEELGALLWAITWGEDKTLSHAVGMGKPYGFGQIKAEISSLECLYNHSDDNEYKEASENKRKVWMKIFTDYMKKNDSNWESCEQLKELKAMADPKNAGRSGWDLSHMSLKDKNGNNQFVDAKKSYSILASYSSEGQEINRQRGGFGSNKNHFNLKR